MEYKLISSGRTLQVIPFSGDVLDYDRDFVYFMNFAREHGYNKLQYCKSTISFQQQTSQLKQHEDKVFIENNILDSYKIVRNKKNGKVVIFRDGLPVYIEPKLKDVYEEIEKTGFCITDRFELAKSFKTIYFSKNYIILFSDDDIWFSNGVIDIHGHKFKKVDGLIIKGGYDD